MIFLIDQEVFGDRVMEGGSEAHSDRFVGVILLESHHGKQYCHRSGSAGGRAAVLNQQPLMTLIEIFCWREEVNGGIWKVSLDKTKEESIHENSVVFARTSQIWKFHVDNQILLSLRFPQCDPTTD
jgi:hypothetical protein